MHSKLSTNRLYFLLDYGIAFLAICFIIQDLLQNYIPIFQYLDEIASVFFFAFYIANLIKRKKIKQSELYIIILTATVVFIGIISNLTSGVNRPTAAILMDIGNTFKFVLIYLGLIYSSQKLLNKKVLKIIVVFVKLYLLVLLACATINLFTDIGMYYDIRYGLRAFSFVYGIPGVIINHCTYSLVVFIADKSINNKNNTIFIIISLLLMASTLRSRAFGLIALFCLMYYFFFIAKRKEIKSYIFLTIIIVTIIGASQIETYFIDNTNSVRATFLRYSFYIAKKYFPLGTGFSSYGSFAAATYYSPLYYLFGFNNKYGMGPDQNLFLSDNYWPTILGQFGVIGFIVFVALIFKYFQSLYYHICKNKNNESKFIYTFVLLDILMSSIQSSYISHYSMIALIFITMLCFNNNYHNKKDTEPNDNRIKRTARKR